MPIKKKSNAPASTSASAQTVLVPELLGESQLGGFTVPERPARPDSVAPSLAPPAIVAAAPEATNTALAVRGSELKTRALALRIVDSASAQVAGEVLTKEVKPALKDVDDAYDEIISDLHGAHKRAVAKKKFYAAPLLEAEAAIKSAIADFVRKERAEREAEIQRAQMESRRLAEEDALAQAAELLESGAEEEGQELLEAVNSGALTVASMAPPALASKPTKIAGVGVGETWTYEIVDAGKLDSNFLIPNEKAIAATVKAMGLKAHGVCGDGALKIYTKPQVSARG